MKTGKNSRCTQWYLCLLVLLISLQSAHATKHTNNRLSPLGINTNEVMDMDSSVPFVDLFKQSMP
ncbi:MAG: hypothetical protein V3U78_02315, partial [Thiotrichaceae bacterium]